MPVGVDVDTFRSDATLARMPRSILSLGRISPSKKIDILVEALGILQKKSVAFPVAFSATICGSDVGNEEYAVSVKNRADELDLTDVIAFKNGVPHSETPALYSAHEVFVNLSRSGMYDKTLFEAAASGCLVVSTSDDFNAHVDGRLSFDDTAEGLANTIENIFALPVAERVNLINDLETFAEDNSLQKWSERVVSEMKI
jgi:glycosyltransferase involved in cell wall biosynthesis